MLGYDDRSPDHRTTPTAGFRRGARFLLVDGRVAATWTVREDGDGSVLTVTPRRGPVRSEAAEAEAARLLAFLAPEGGRVVWALAPQPTS